MSANLQIGCRVQATTKDDVKIGKIAFVGLTSFAPGKWHCRHGIFIGIAGMVFLFLSNLYFYQSSVVGRWIYFIECFRVWLSDFVYDEGQSIGKILNPDLFVPHLTPKY